MTPRRLIAIGLLSGLAGMAIGQDNPVLVGTVTKVTDGDTINVQLSSGPITVRFDSIDAPERDQPWGKEATAALAELLDGQEVALEVTTQDRYERLVATVYLGDSNVNARMVEQGHAWVYRDYDNDKSFYALEAKAKEAELGLWSLPEAQRVPPWQWRRGTRSGGSAAPMGSPATQCGSKTVCGEMTSCEEARLYLKQCGLTRLDGNSDGIPCEELCR